MTVICTKIQKNNATDDSQITFNSSPAYPQVCKFFLVSASLCRNLTYFSRSKLKLTDA